MILNKHQLKLSFPLIFLCLCLFCKQLKEFYNRAPNFVWGETKLDVMLKEFVESGYHLAIVRDVVINDDTDNEYKVIGKFCAYF